MLGMDANPEEWLVAALPCGVPRGRQRGYREGQEYGGRANSHDLHMMAKGPARADHDRCQPPNPRRARELREMARRGAKNGSPGL